MYARIITLACQWSSAIYDDWKRLRGLIIDETPIIDMLHAGMFLAPERKMISAMAIARRQPDFIGK